MTALARRFGDQFQFTTRWRPRSERPAIGTVAVIAWIDEVEGTPYMLPDMYRFHALGLRDEITGHSLRQGKCYWMPEQELLACLK